MRSDASEQDGVAMEKPTEVIVEKANDVTGELLDAMARLLPQLSTSSSLPSHEEVEKMVSSPAVVLLVARSAQPRIVGMLALAIFRVPTGVRAWIEDVVVDKEVRGSGVGGALIEAALMEAAALGAKTVDLTSRPARHAANRLYVRLGFQCRETNVYRYHFATSGAGDAGDGAGGEEDGIPCETGETGERGAAGRRLEQVSPVRDR